MAVHLPDVASLSWIWHDAQLAHFQTCWSEHGDVRVTIQCELNPEEDNRLLVDLGIASRLTVISFVNVWRFQIDITGDNSSWSTIDQWEVLNQSPLIALVNQQRPPIAGIVHHHITTSSGSTLDMVCTEVWIESGENIVEDDTR